MYTESPGKTVFDRSKSPKYVLELIITALGSLSPELCYDKSYRTFY